MDYTQPGLFDKFKKKRKPNGYWTKEKCAREALKFQTRSELKKEAYVIYRSAIKNRFLDDICKHMLPGNLIWTKEACKKASLNFKHKIDSPFVKDTLLIVGMQRVGKTNTLSKVLKSQET